MADGSDKPECRFDFKRCVFSDECMPIRTYDEVLTYKTFRPSWTNSILRLCNISDTYYPGASDDCHSTGSELNKERKKRTDIPKTVICHDLKGGYWEDRYVDGSSKPDEYRFFHWAGIDTFIYFSHQLVTIPPLMWINAAHLHGTKVLGTLITEWREGQLVWMEILKSDATVQEFVDSLVAICVNFGFDGYLLNIENVIAEPLISRLEYFVSILHNKLHSRVLNAQLLWYDSVTKDGKLSWQNELNEMNRVFYDNCDGIFLNYSWKEMNLKNSAIEAGNCRSDVYVGIDVFGRNFYEGGGYNSHKAAKLARENDLSLAIFAPSWTHEYLGGPHFMHLEYVFWHSLWPYLYIHGPCDLPFSTSFCQGYGEKLFSKGKVISTSPWYNLSKQEYQPTVPSCQSDEFVNLILEAKKNESITEAVNEEAKKLITTGCVQHYCSDAYNGGGSLRICSGNDRISSHRIFVCNFKCSGEVLVSMASKSLCENNTDFNILLQTDAETARWWMLKPGVRRTMDKQVILPLKQNEVDELKPKVNEKFYDSLAPCDSSSWKLRHYLLDLQDSIVEVKVQLTVPGTSALLGLFQIVPL